MEAGDGAGGAVIVPRHLGRRQTVRDRDVCRRRVRTERGELFLFFHIFLTFKGRGDAPVLLSFFFLTPRPLIHLSPSPPIPPTRPR